MTDSPNRGQWGNRDEPTQAFGNGYPGQVDPAYASQMPYGPPYQPPAPTRPLPGYPPYGYDPYAGGGQYPPSYPPGQGGEPPEPDGPKYQWMQVAELSLAEGHSTDGHGPRRARAGCRS